MAELDLQLVMDAPAGLDIQPAGDSAPSSAPNRQEVTPVQPERQGPDWVGLFSGLDTLDDRLSPDQKQWFSQLDRNSENPKEARAAALNQAYLSTQIKGLPPSGPLSANWDAYKKSYAKLVYGIEGANVSDATLYGAIGKRLKDDADSESMGEIKPWTWQDARASDVRRMTQSVGRFWESINQPIAKLPDPPDTVPDLPAAGMNNPALAAGVYKGLKPLIEGVESPFGVATLGVGALLGSAAKTYPLAKTVLMGMTGLFSGLMTKAGVENAGRIPEVFNDPLSSTQDKAAVVTETVADGLAGLMGAMGFALEALPKAEVKPLLSEIEGKGPLDVAKILDERAKAIELPPEDAATVQEAVKQLEDVGEHTDVLEDTPDTPPTPEKPVTKRVADLGDPVGIKNESVNAELRAMGEPELTEAENIKQSDQMKAAVDKLKENENAGSALVAELQQSKRTPTSDEVALLTAEMNRRRLARDAAQQKLLDAVEIGDKDMETQAQFEIAASRDAFTEIADLTKTVGSEQGRAFAARQMMIREDYSLAAVERRRLVARKGKPLTTEAQARITELTGKLAELDKKFADYRVEQAAATAENRPPVREPARPPSTNRVREYISAQAEAARQRIKDRIASGRVSSGLDPLEIGDYAIIGADYITKGVTKFADWSVEMVKEFGDRVKPHLQDIFDRATENRKDATRLGAFKTRTLRATEKVQEKLASGDVSKEPPRKPIPLDAEALRIKTEYERVKRALDLEQKAEEMAARNPVEKARDTFQAWVRFGALSYPSVIAKLTTAAMGRFLVTPVEQLLGVGFGKILPEKLTSKAQFENVPSLGALMRSEVKAVVEGLTTGIKGSVDLLKNKETDLTTLMKGEQYPSGVLEYMGKIHAALKNPAKEADFYRRLQLVTEAEAARGVDVTNPVEQMRLMHSAYEYAQRSIFMQDNALTTSYKVWSNYLQPQAKAGKIPADLKATGRVLSEVAKAEMPIVKVPVNVVSEISEYVSGALQGPARLAWAYGKGIDGLTNAEADMIMRQFKKGSIGAAVLLLGYYQAENIGGFYQRGEKRKPDDARAMAVKVGDANVPKQLADSPLFDVMQYGATIRRVGDELIKKAHGDTKGPLVGLFAATVGLAEEVPFVRETLAVRQFMEAETAKSAAEQKAASILIPGFVQWTASQMDKETPFSQFEQPRSRKATTFPEALKKDLPGLRQEVPERKKH